MISKIKQELGSDTENNETGLYKNYVDAKNKYDEKNKLYVKQKNDLDAKLSKKAIDREIGIKYKVDFMDKLFAFWITETSGYWKPKELTRGYLERTGIL